MTEALKIRMGDVVELRNGERIVSDGISQWYEDADGRHEGPFLHSHRPGAFERYMLSDVVRVVTPNPRICRFCGDGVTSTNPECDYCRNCHYGGVALEDRYAPVLALFREKLPDARTIGIEHTGGGCFWLAVHGPEGSPYYWAVTDGDAGIPDFEQGEAWGVVCRYADEEHARDVIIEGTRWNEYEGVPIMPLGPFDENGWPTGHLGHDEVIEAIAADMKAVMKS